MTSNMQDCIHSNYCHTLTRTPHTIRSA
jgi:hypothetical protein